MSAVTAGCAWSVTHTVNGCRMRLLLCSRAAQGRPVVVVHYEAQSGSAAVSKELLKFESTNERAET